MALDLSREAVLDVANLWLSVRQACRWNGDEGSHLLPESEGFHAWEGPVALQAVGTPPVGTRYLDSSAVQRKWSLRKALVICPSWNGRLIFWRESLKIFVRLRMQGKISLAHNNSFTFSPKSKQGWLDSILCSQLTRVLERWRRSYWRIISGRDFVMLHSNTEMGLEQLCIVRRLRKCMQHLRSTNSLESIRMNEWVYGWKLCFIVISKMVERGTKPALHGLMWWPFSAILFVWTVGSIVEASHKSSAHVACVLLEKPAEHARSGCLESYEFLRDALNCRSVPDASVTPSLPSWCTKENNVRGFFVD